MENLPKREREHFAPVPKKKNYNVPAKEYFNGRRAAVSGAGKIPGN